MPNLKDIKRRILSVQNTQKITRAMKMVAAAKVKKTEALLKASLPYSSELLKMIQRLMAAKPLIEKSQKKYTKANDNYPELLNQRDLKTVGILVVTSDKGLAGAYNANVVRTTLRRIREFEENSIDYKLFVVGNKGYQALKRRSAPEKIVQFYTKLPAVPTSGSSAVIAEDIAESYVNENIDRLEIITTYFKSSLSYEVQIWQLLPLTFQSEKEKQGIEPEMMFEPDLESVLQKIVPLYISNRIYHAIIESATSEQAARMQAMSAATTNAGDMIKILTIDYNKARQASITQELLEVVNGAEALR